MTQRQQGRLAVALVAMLIVAALPAAETSWAPRPAAANDLPTWDGTRQPLPAKLKRRMRGVSWRPGCPVHLDQLRLLKVPYWGFDGEIHRGRMVVRAKQSRNTLRVLRRLYEERFPIERMKLIEAYDGDDDRSMAANNTSAFNCRTVGGTSRWSEHAYGRAVDINPVQNPYVRGSTVSPEAGRAYLDRSDVRPGMVVQPGPVVRAFKRVGWVWGGTWQYSKDYQHFSSTGR